MRSYVVERLTGISGATDQVTRAARMMAERALPLLLKRINDRFSAAFEVEIKAVEIGRQPDVLGLAGRYDAMAMAGSDASADALVLLIDSAAIAALTNVLFGGDAAAPAPSIDRDLSPIEKQVAAQAFEHAAQALNGSGPRSLNLRLPLPAPVTGAELKKLTLRDGPAVRIVYTLFTPGGSGTLTLSMPQRVLLQFRSGREEGEAGGAWSARFTDEVLRSAVGLQAVIPIGRMTLAELAFLREGQVLEMPQGAQGDTRLIARDKTLFVGEFGKLGQSYTIRISHPFDAGQDLMNGILPG